MNKYFALITTLSNEYGGNKKKVSSKKIEKPLPVPMDLPLSNQIMQDFMVFSEFIHFQL